MQKKITREGWTFKPLDTICMNDLCDKNTREECEQFKACLYAPRKSLDGCRKIKISIDADTH